MRTRLLQDLQKKTIRFKSIVALTCLLLTSVSAFAQTKTVTGTVTDAANEPLIGASVLVQGTSTGTITDMDGKYSISVTPDDVLAFSYVGMTSQSVKVGAQTARTKEFRAYHIRLTTSERMRRCLMDNKTFVAEAIHTTTTQNMRINTRNLRRHIST